MQQVLYVLTTKCYGNWAKEANNHSHANIYLFGQKDTMHMLQTPSGKRYT